VKIFDWADLAGVLHSFPQAFNPLPHTRNNFIPQVYDTWYIKLTVILARILLILQLGSSQNPKELYMVFLSVMSVTEYSAA